MTPLAAKVARELTLLKKDRTFDDTAHVLDLFDQDMHCFEVSAIAKSVRAVMEDPLARDDVDEAWSVWRDIETLMPRLFLPSPVTWLEQIIEGKRMALVIREDGDFFSLITVHDSERGPFSLHMCRFRARGVLEAGDRIDVDALDVAELFPDDPDRTALRDHVRLDVGNLDPTKATADQMRAVRAARDLYDSEIKTLERRTEIMKSGVDVLSAANCLIGMTVLTLDLINTPGLIGLKQREINKGLARSLSRVGRYPLLAWSEVVLKHQTRIAEPGERVTGTTYHKCLHFVRSHLRHYRDGHVTVIPAHWRGDPALGIKRTRYRLAA